MKFVLKYVGHCHDGTDQLWFAAATENAWETPSANLYMTLTDPAASEPMRAGQEFYLDLTPANHNKTKPCNSSS